MALLLALIQAILLTLIVFVLTGAFAIFSQKYPKIAYTIIAIIFIACLTYVLYI